MKTVERKRQFIFHENREAPAILFSFPFSLQRKKKEKKIVEKHASKVPNTWTIVFLYRGYIPFNTIRDQVGQE